MTSTVTLTGFTPNSVLEIVKELRSMKYVQSVHFDFEYVPPKSDPISGHWVDKEKYSIFTFYIDSLASWFTLKYG